MGLVIFVGILLYGVFSFTMGKNESGKGGCSNGDIMSKLSEISESLKK